MTTVDVDEIERIAEDPLLVGNRDLVFVETLRPFVDQSAGPHQARDLRVQFLIFCQCPVEVQDALDDRGGDAGFVEETHEVFSVRWTGTLMDSEDGVEYYHC